MHAHKIKMSTKMKGLFKGLRYISQIFDEDQQKEQDMQIGLPTDVKHVAHVGWDGPGSANSTSVDSPNWMKDLGPSTPGINAATGKDNAEVKWVSEDSKKAQRRKKDKEKEKEKEKEQEEGGEGSKASRRRSTDNSNPLDTSPKAKPSRRQSSSDANKNAANDAPKKTRRKKNRSAANGGSDAAQKLNSDDEERDGRFNS